MKLRSQMRLLVAAKEHHESTTYTVRGMVEATKPYTTSGKGVPVSTIQGLMNDKWERIERDYMQAICLWLGCTPGELFKVE